VLALHSKAETDLKEALLDQLAEQVRHAPVSVTMAMALIAYMASHYVSVWYWGTWLILVAAAQGLRWHLFRQLPKSKHIAIDKRLNIATLMNAGNTILHSASLVWFPLFSLYHGAVQSLIFIAMGVTTVITAAGYFPFTLTHILLGLVPLFSLWTWSGLFSDGGGTALILSVIGVGYTASLFRIAGDAFILYKETFNIRVQLEAALARAESAGAAKTRFLASASHDLRQPIHTLSLFSAALGMRNHDERTNHLVKNIKAAVEALAYQLDGLLDISKLDAGIVTVRHSTFCLAKLLHRIADEFSALAENRGITLIFDCPARAAVNSDSALIDRIISNLLSNAIHHNMHCTVTMRVLQLGSTWQLIIADTGCGIAEAEQEKVFEEFYQVENPERDRSKGLGLGLAIVRRLSNLLNISMDFQSRPGSGTQFSFTLAAVDAQQQEESIVDHFDNSLNSLVVLVVDDEWAVREGMRVLLESLGCRVATADSSDNAISSATTEKPNIALVDLRLRDHDDGLITIDRLRHIYPALPAIIISGDTAPDRLLAISESGIPVLTKPVLIGPLKEEIIRNCFPME
jgi:two-component system, sensor histidine kinase